MNEAQLIAHICERSQNYAWFLGAGASRSAGLPTANDIIWDLKRNYYCQQENQDVKRHELQVESVRAKIQTYFAANGFPPDSATDAYSTYFEKIFADDRERQRKYIKARFTDDRISLTVGSRVLGALISCGLSRIVFTTNFDNVIERSVAEVGGQDLLPFHLEGSSAAARALDNEEFPIYCKLHGDFRFDNLKNLTEDLRRQNDQLAACFINASNRFGMIVNGYSGRDDSVLQLFNQVLNSSNPFPHGLFWTKLKGTEVLAPVLQLINNAVSKGC